MALVLRKPLSPRGEDAPAAGGGGPFAAASPPPPLSARNLGRPTSSQLLCAFLLGGLPRVVRGLVSRRKRRFFDAATGLDLDLSYITDSLVGAGYPSSGVEALYRNPAPWTRRFLEGRHGGGRCRVWNLCAERSYPEALLGGEIQCTSRFVWLDHTPPPFALLRPLCEDVAAWQAADAANVAVIRAFGGALAPGAAPLRALNNTPHTHSHFSHGPEMQTARRERAARAPPSPRRWCTAARAPPRTRRWRFLGTAARTTSGALPSRRRRAL
jgi:hypothetical protein